MSLRIRKITLLKSDMLTLADRRLFNYLLHNAFDKLRKKLTFEIKLDDLEGVFGAGEPPIDQLKQAIARLQRMLVEIEAQPDKRMIWLQGNLLGTVELDEGRRILKYSYPILCQELLTDPVLLETCLIQAHFEHKYSNQIYDLLASPAFESKKEFKIEISDFRSRLNIHPTTLTNFSDLNRFVLVHALNEINAYASFAVKLETVRKGRKVISLIFHLTEKRNIFVTRTVRDIIPPKRPRMFIEHADYEWAYAYLLNAETKERNKYFNMAQKKATKKAVKIEDDDFDTPDKWFEWVKSEVSKLRDQN